ncbi:trypsin delta-like [Epargyreus clarus]|uniref:trypsin delta-like n=1 Tax=Epargyreus clarus TaxID=520877 RepID=UPI003C302726
MCGAVVIGSRTLLTAAHCVTTYISDPSILRVTVGTSYRLSGGKSYDLKRIVIHESYTSATLENDIALLVTRSDMSFSKSVKAINIASKNFNLPNGTEALVSGFGTVSYEGSPSDVLLAAKVNIVPKESCKRSYLGIASIADGMVCASANNPPRDACQGDSGGPLVTKNVLIGIVSWGEKCANPVYPGVYTRVSEYESWIVSRVNTYG